MSRKQGKVSTAVVRFNFLLRNDGTRLLRRSERNFLKEKGGCNVVALNFDVIYFWFHVTFNGEKETGWDEQRK